MDDQETKDLIQRQELPLDWRPVHWKEQLP